MDNIIYIVIAAAVIVFAGTTMLFLTTDAADSIIGFKDTAEDVECQTKTNSWESGDSVNEECIDNLPEEHQKDAAASVLEEDLT